MLTDANVRPESGQLRQTYTRDVARHEVAEPQTRDTFGG